MHIERKTQSGLTTVIIVAWATEKRLRSTCYRGPSHKKAGNFISFDSSDDLLGHEVVLRELLAQVDTLWARQDRSGTWSFTLTCPDFIGWESTAPLANYNPNDLEPLRLNTRANALSVKLSPSHQLSAPKTKNITVIFELNSEGEDAVVVIHSIYPGTDVGPLDGDVTQREQRVFFSWDHPGEE